MTIITKQRTLQKSELLETNGELTSEYTISQTANYNKTANFNRHIEKNGELTI